MKKFFSLIILFFVWFSLFACVPTPSEKTVEALETAQEIKNNVIEVRASNLQGSGVILYSQSEGIVVVSSLHLAGDDGNFIKVRFADGEWLNTDTFNNESIITVLGCDEVNDLVIFSVAAMPEIEIHDLRNKYSEQYVGQVCAVGNKDLSGIAITEGNAVGLKYIDLNLSSERETEVIVHDRIIGHGSSGGALVSADGIIGITVAHNNTADEGYSIPFKKVMGLLEELTKVVDKNDSLI